MPPGEIKRWADLRPDNREHAPDQPPRSYAPKKVLIYHRHIIINISFSGASAVTQGAKEGEK